MDHQYDKVADIVDQNHYYSSVDHQYDQVANTNYETINEEVGRCNNNTAEITEHFEDVVRLELTEGAHACKDAGCDQPASYEQVPTPNLADILRQVAVRNIQRNHSSEVKLFDTSRQADSIYECIATYEQVPDPATIWLQRSTRCASLYEVAQTYEVTQTYEVAQTYESITGYERVRYDKTLEEIIAHMKSGDVTIISADAVSPCSLHHRDSVAESALILGDSETQSD